MDSRWAPDGGESELTGSINTGQWQEEMMLAAFDLEIYNDPVEGGDWAIEELGISCVGLACRRPFGRHKMTQLWFSEDAESLNEKQISSIVDDLRAYVHAGYTLVGWNSLAFDFLMLAHYSGRYQDCAKLALNHIDLMFQVVCTKGHYLGLDKASQGMGKQGKVKSVVLSDGSILDDMDGAIAPMLWRKGEQAAVLSYLQGDVSATLDLAEALQEEKGLRWISGSGRDQYMPMPQLYTVNDCLGLPPPDTSWMTDPPDPWAMAAWALEHA